MTSQTKTIYTAPTETRTFAIGEVVDYFIGTSRYAARIVSFDGGIFHFTIGASTEVHKALGAVFAKALAPHRRGVEVMRNGW
jgi:hypothetical protein